MILISVLFLAVDGITIAGKQRNYRLVQPWAPEPDSELIAGSLSSRRIFVPDKSLRNLLIPFSVQVGLLHVDFDSLKVKLGELPADSYMRTLLPFVEDGECDEKQRSRAKQADR